MNLYKRNIYIVGFDYHLIAALINRFAGECNEIHIFSSKEEVHNVSTLFKTAENNIELHKLNTIKELLPKIHSEDLVVNLLTLPTPNNLTKEPSHKISLSLELLQKLAYDAQYIVFVPMMRQSKLNNFTQKLDRLISQTMENFPNAKIVHVPHIFKDRDSIIVDLINMISKTKCFALFKASNFSFIHGFWLQKDLISIIEAFDKYMVEIDVGSKYCTSFGELVGLLTADNNASYMRLPRWVFRCYGLLFNIKFPSLMRYYIDFINYSRLPKKDSSLLHDYDKMLLARDLKTYMNSINDVVIK